MAVGPYHTVLKDSRREIIKKMFSHSARSKFVEVHTGFHSVFFVCQEPFWRSRGDPSLDTHRPGCLLVEQTPATPPWTTLHRFFEI